MQEVLIFRGLYNLAKYIIMIYTFNKSLMLLN
jgi:hypothetical protein